jgi:FtsH-binding integral membrane protein
MSFKESLTKQRDMGKVGTFIASLIIGTWIAIEYILPIFNFGSANSLGKVDLILGVAIGFSIAVVVVKLIKKGDS